MARVSGVTRRITKSMEAVAVPERKKRTSDMSELVAVDGRYLAHAEAETLRPAPMPRPSAGFLGDRALPGLDECEPESEGGRYGWAIGE